MWRLMKKRVGSCEWELQIVNDKLQIVLGLKSKNL